MQALNTTSTRPQFDGETYRAPLDYARLSSQLDSVRYVMQDRVWRTLSEISALTGYPESSISARLRDLRKPKFGGHEVERRRRGDGRKGLHEYRVVIQPELP